MVKKSRKFLDIVLVVWEDATEDEAGWHDEDTPDLALTECESLGFLVSKTAKRICLRADQSSDGGKGRRTSIPNRSFVQRIIKLGRKDTDTGEYLVCCPNCGDVIAKEGRNK